MTSIRSGCSVVSMLYQHFSYISFSHWKNDQHCSDNSNRMQGAEKTLNKSAVQSYTRIQLCYKLWEFLLWLLSPVSEILDDQGIRDNLEIKFKFCTIILMVMYEHKYWNGLLHGHLALHCQSIRPTFLSVTSYSSWTAITAIVILLTANYSNSCILPASLLYL